MKISSTAKYALGVTAAAAMLAGCSSGASSLAPTTPTMGAQARGTAATTFTAQIGFKGITVDAHPVTPDAKKAGQLLYISDDGTNEVETFAWPKPKSSTGTLSGFSEPQGMCADTKGDVYITNTGDSNTLEYKGTKLVTTLADAGQFPVGCAVDAAGDVAVTNIVSTADGPGSVTFYKKGKGAGKNIPITGLSRVFFGAYDKGSNLWVDGTNSESAASVAELTKAGKVVDGTLTGGSFEFPGGVNFDGKDIAINDQDAATVYQLKKFKIVGSTPLSGAVDIDSDFIDVPTKLLIGPDAGSAQVEIYKYPAGGTATQVLTGFSEPIGAGVSAK
jgi:serine/threonine-protein kinase